MEVAIIVTSIAFALFLVAVCIYISSGGFGIPGEDEDEE